MKIKVYEIQPDKGLAICCEISTDVIKDGYLDDAQVGDIITIKVIEMEESEYEALPECMGF
jgi:hypothetical protein